MGRPKKSPTKLVRMYESDFNDVRSRFPDVKIADYIHVTSRTNPFIQVEALLRGKKKIAKK